MLAALGCLAVLQSPVRARNTIPTVAQIRRAATLRRLPTEAELRRLFGPRNVAPARYEPSDAGTIKVHISVPKAYAIFEPRDANAFQARNHKEGEIIVLDPTNRAQYIVLNDFSADQGYSDREAKLVIANATRALGKPRVRRFIPDREMERYDEAGHVAEWRVGRLTFKFVQRHYHGQAGLWITASP